MLPIVMSLFVLPVLSQTELTKANDCYSKNDYQCAVDNYLVALEKKSYKESDKYVVEYRIALGYSELAQPDKAIDYFKKAIISKPDYMIAYWELANEYYDAGKHADAVTHYKKAYSMATDSKDKDDLTLWTGNAYNQQKSYTNSVAEFKKIQSREGKFVKVDQKLGDAFYNLAKYDSAMTYYRKAEPYFKQGDSTIKQLKYWLAKSYRLLGKPTEAMEQIEGSLSLDPKYAAAMWEKGILYANKKEYPTAIEWYKKALPSYTGNSPDSYVLCGNISACYQNVNNWVEAVNWQIKRKAFSENKYKEYAKIASYQYGRLKQIKEAEKTATEAIDQYKIEAPERISKIGSDDYVKLVSIAGKIALEKKDTAQALKYFETAIGLSKGNYESNAGAAEIAWARKQENEYKKLFGAINKSFYDTLLSTKKEIANVYGRSAYTDAYVNKYKYYSSSVMYALQFDSMQREAVLLWPVVLTTGSASDLGKHRAACLSILNKAAAYYSLDKAFASDVYNSKAVMLESKDTGAIRKALLEAVKIYPDNIKAWDNLMKYYTSYDHAAGVTMVEKLIAVLKKQKDNVSTATAYIYKGDFLWRLDKKEDAKKAWQEALIWDAANTTAAERIKM